MGGVQLINKTSFQDKECHENTQFQGAQGQYCEE